jgi:hypothetical protein
MMPMSSYVSSIAACFALLYVHAFALLWLTSLILFPSF